MPQPNTLRRPLTLFVALSVLVACGYLAATSGATASRLAIGGNQAGRANAKIAVVDISSVIDSLDEQTALEGELQKLIDEANTELQAQQGLVETLRSDLELLTPGTQAPTRKMLEIREAEVLLQTKQESLRAFIGEQTGSMLLRLYGKVRDAVAQIAERDGYDLILIDDSGVQLPAAGQQQQVLGFINGRRVLYASDGIDLTDMVTQFMNNRFNAGQP